jgi:uncharacterized protein YuzE
VRRAMSCHPSWHTEAPSSAGDEDSGTRSVTFYVDHAAVSGAIAGGCTHLTYDATTDVAYLSLRPLAQGELVGPTLLLETDRGFAGFVALDFSLADGRAVGVEFQRASACLPAELLASAERTDGRSLANRFDERVGRRLDAQLRALSGRQRQNRRRRTH